MGAVDRLTIVSHDKFQEIVDYANSPDSVIRGGLKVIHITDERNKVYVAEPEIVNRISEGLLTYDKSETAGKQAVLFENPKEQEAAKVTLEIIRREFERLPRSSDLTKPEIQQKIVERVNEILTPDQKELEGIGEKVDVAKVVASTITLHNELSIDIPKIIVQPVGDVIRGYREFSLNLSSIHLLPVDNEILIQELHRREQHRLISGTGILPEERLEDYLVRGLIDFNDVCYDDHAELLYKLAGQAVAHLRSYLNNEEEVVNVLQYHQQALVNLIHAQMQEYYEEKATALEAHVSKGFTTLRPNNYSVPAGESERDFRVPVSDKHDIRKMLFIGFRKCLYRAQERRFAVILENDKEVMKWFKPAQGDLRIHYTSDASYEPDFVAETKSVKFLCEAKSAAEMTDKEVQAKARAAVEWCKNATSHELKHGGKPWAYLLVPHNIISDNKTLQGLAASCAYNG